MLTGDLGTALSSGQDIATSIGGRLWNTLFLAFWAAIVAVPLAIILGLLAVRYRNGWVDKLISGSGAGLDLAARNSSSAICSSISSP